MDFPSIVLRLPCFLILILFIDNRRIEDHPCGSHALTYSCRIDQGLEGGSRLAVDLQGPIVLATTEIIASDHGPNGTSSWLQRDQPALDEGSLFELHINDATIQLLNHNPAH